MIKRGMSFEFADTGTNAGQTGFDPPKQFKLPFKMKKVSGGDVDDIETGDVTRIMPRLRQIHKLGYTLQGHKDFQGLRIAIENRRGSVRKGTDSDGNEWRTKMKHPYGYIVGTRGADGEPVDTYVGPKEDAPAAFVVHQHKDTGKGYDEDKVMLGFRNKREAKEAYLEHYDDPKFLGPISRVSMDRFRQLVASKRQLVKISHASWMGMLDELQSIGGLEKEALGINEIAGIGKLAKAPQRVVDRERKRLVRKAGPAVGALLGAGVGAARGARKGKLLSNVLGGIGTGATLGWLPDIVATAGEAGKRYRRVVK